MRIPNIARKWPRLPGRLAVLVGLGAAAAVGAQAKPPDAAPTGGPSVIPEPRSASSALALRFERGEVYLSEQGGEFRLLRLGDTAEARLLKELLAAERGASDPAGVPLKPTILAGAGGDGFFWHPFAKASSTAKTRDNARGAAAASATPGSQGVGGGERAGAVAPVGARPAGDPANRAQ